LSPAQVANITVNMVREPEGRSLSVVHSSRASTRAGWTVVNGTIDFNGTPVCALMLANGQHMFSCNETLGRFSLEVPLDNSGNVTLFAFVSGFQPLKVVFPAPDDGASNTGNKLFDELDAALAQRTVSTDSPEGLWVIYSKGISDTQLTVAGSGSLDQVDTTNLYAVVAKVVLLEDNAGGLQVHLSDCTAAWGGNNLAVTRGPKSFAVFPLTFGWLNDTVASSPYKPGNVTFFNNASYKTYRDTEFMVTLVDNKEMIFPADFGFQDTEGDHQGGFTATFKGRKFSDDFYMPLGQFVIDGVDRDTHCFEYQNISTSSVNTTGVQGQTFIQEDDFVKEVFSFDSYPDLADGISYLLYQNRGAYTSVINGQDFPVDELIAIEVSNTQGQIPRTSVNSAIASHLIDFTLNFDVTAGATLGYAISNGASTSTGTVEARY